MKINKNLLLIRIGFSFIIGGCILFIIIQAINFFSNSFLLSYLICCLLITIIGFVIIIIDGEIDTKRLRKAIKEADVFIEKEKRRLILEKIWFLLSIYYMFKDDEK